MLLSFYKYNIKKKKNFYKLVLYFICLNYKILFFLYFDQLINIKNVLNNINLKYIIISPFFLNYFISKNFNLLKKNLIILCSNNIVMLLSLFINNIILANNINIISINYYYINIKYLKNINIWYNILNNNYKIFIIFLIKIIFLLKNIIKSSIIFFNT